MTEECPAHSGIISDINYLKKENEDQWTKITKVDDEVSTMYKSFMTRINVILGGIVVAVIMLLINLLFK